MPEQILDKRELTFVDGQSESDGMNSLTARERQVLAEVIAGNSNKKAGRKLGISPRTVEVHRARIMDKLGAKNTADLVRIVVEQKAPLAPNH